MNVERIYSEKQIAAFKEWVYKMGVEGVLTDGDDTLWEAYNHFWRWMKAFGSYWVARRPEINEENFMKRLREVDNETCRRIGVAPSRWGTVIDTLSQEYGVDESVFREGRYIIDEIYKTSGVVFGGVRATLDVLRLCGPRLGLVTHAGREWTDIKLRVNGLEDIFDVVVAIDPEEEPFKGPEHWKRGCDSLGVDPKHIIAIGDNVKGDGWGAYNAGIERIVILPSPWGEYANGDMPPGAYRASRFRDVISVLLSTS